MLLLRFTVRPRASLTGAPRRAVSSSIFATLFGRIVVANFITCRPSPLSARGRARTLRTLPRSRVPQTGSRPSTGPWAPSSSASICTDSQCSSWGSVAAVVARTTALRESVANPPNGSRWRRPDLFAFARSASTGDGPAVAAARHTYVRGVCNQLRLQECSRFAVLLGAAAAAAPVSARPSASTLPEPWTSSNPRLGVCYGYCSRWRRSRLLHRCGRPRRLVARIWAAQTRSSSRASPGRWPHTTLNHLIRS